MRVGSVRPRTLGGIFVLSAAVVAAVAGAAGHATARSGLTPLAAHAIVAKSQTQPRPTSSCAALLGIRCYSPAQFANAYRLNPLHAAGIDGQRPDDRDRRPVRLADDRRRPAPVRPGLRRRRTLRRPGRPGDRAGSEADDHPPRPARRRPSTRPTATWSAGRRRRRSTSSGRTSSRPAPSILLVETPVSETEGVQGFPEIVAGRELRDRPPPRRRDLAELRRDRGDLPDHAGAARPARARSSNAASKRRDRARAARATPARRTSRLNLADLYPMPGQQLALERPARDEHRRARS